MKHYPESLKKEHQAGNSVKALSRKYGISQYSLQNWCGLRPEVELHHAAPVMPLAQRRGSAAIQKRFFGL